MNHERSGNPTRSRSRTTTELALDLEKRLISYAAIASAAGMGLIAGSPVAEAKVVYTQTWMSIVPNAGPLVLDLNNDGTPDFQFSAVAKFYYSEYGSLNVSPQNASNGIWGSASALPAGVKIGPSGTFKTGRLRMATAKFYSRDHGTYTAYLLNSGGPWRQATRLYLGLKFVIQGQIHYGWARLNVTATNDGVYGAINGYAYETIPNKPIASGAGGGYAKRKVSNGVSSPPTARFDAQPGGLGVLAGGTPLR